jgi:hypothetical protein
MTPRPAAAQTALLLAALALAPAAEAKEHSAGCLVLTTLAERLRNTLVLATVHRSRGSALAAYQVLRTNALSFLHERPARDCGAVPRVLERALARAAAAPTAMGAGLELDLGYTAAMGLTLAGRFPSDNISLKEIDVPESAQYGESCPDVFKLAQRLEGADGNLAGRVSAVLADLRARPRCPQVKDLLEHSPAADLPAAVDAFLLDEVQGSPNPQNPIARCPELPLVLDRITAAISVGAPLFNKGNHEGCRALYDRTARNLADEAIPAGRCPAVRAELETARAEAAGAGNPGDAAWALRRGFDRITAAVSPRAPD